MNFLLANVGLAHNSLNSITLLTKHNPSQIHHCIMTNCVCILVWTKLYGLTRISLAHFADQQFQLCLFIANLFVCYYLCLSPPFFQSSTFSRPRTPTNTYFERSNTQSSCSVVLSKLTSFSGINQTYLGVGPPRCT